MKRYFYQMDKNGEQEVEISNYDSDTEVMKERKRRKVIEIRKEHKKVRTQSAYRKGEWLENKTRSIITSLGGECNITQTKSRDTWSCDCETSECEYTEKESDTEEYSYEIQGDFGIDFYGNIEVDGKLHKFIGQCKNWDSVTTKRNIGSEPMAALKGKLLEYRDNFGLFITGIDTNLRGRLKRGQISRDFENCC